VDWNSTNDNLLINELLDKTSDEKSRMYKSQMKISYTMRTTQKQKNTKTPSLKRGIITVSPIIMIAIPNKFSPLLSSVQSV